jgi:uncharacterized membrane protein (UPF0127 family)
VAFKLLKPIIILATIVSLNYNLLPKGKKCDILIINTQNRRIRLTVEIVNRSKTRQKGLMFRRSLNKNHGMLFVFEREQYRRFWMKNTYIPLSIAYINKYGIINEIYDMKPLDTSQLYPSLYPAQFAIEVNQGWFARNKIKKGCRVLLHGCIGE